MTLLISCAIQYFGIEYRWAGNDARGFDCSGLVLKVLRDIGYNLPDMTSQGIYNHFTKKNLTTCDPYKEPDCLVFFGQRRDLISHIGISTGDGYMIEAGGAGRNSLNMSRGELLAIDARVRKARIDRRSDLIESIKVQY